MTLSEQHLLELRCRLEKYITRREGMIADNQVAKHLGRQMVYGYKEFGNLALGIEELENHICWLGGR